MKQSDEGQHDRGAGRETHAAGLYRMLIGGRGAGGHPQAYSPEHRPSVILHRAVDSQSPVRLGKGKRLFADNGQPRTFRLTRGAVSPNGLIAATSVRNGEVKTATAGGAHEPSAAELARREKLKREG